MDNNENYNKKGFYTVLYTLAAIFIILAFGISILNSGNTGNNNEVDLEENISPVDKSNVKPLTTETTTEVKAEAQTEQVTKVQQQIMLFRTMVNFLYLMTHRKWNGLYQVR